LINTAQRLLELTLTFAPYSLQSVQNAAARLICRLRRFDHVTDALVSLHWLLVPIPEARRLQGRRANAQGSAWDRTGVSRTCCIRVADLPGRQSLIALLPLTAW